MEGVLVPVLVGWVVLLSEGGRGAGSHLQAPLADPIGDRVAPPHPFKRLLCHMSRVAAALSLPAHVIPRGKKKERSLFVSLGWGQGLALQIPLHGCKAGLRLPGSSFSPGWELRSSGQELIPHLWRVQVGQWDCVARDYSASHQRFRTF